MHRCRQCVLYVGIWLRTSTVFRGHFLHVDRDYPAFSLLVYSLAFTLRTHFHNAVAQYQQTLLTQFGISAAAFASSSAEEILWKTSETLI